MIQFHDINGKLTQADSSLISVFDIGLLRGYGIFDFFPIRKGQPLFVEDYFDRFYRSASLMKLEVPIDRPMLLDRVARLVAQNDIVDGYIKLVLTGGTSSDGYTPTKNNLYILQHGKVTYPDHFFSNGIRLILQNHHRNNPTIKSLNYANAVRQRELLDTVSALDILYHDGRYIQETSRANFFLIDQHKVLHTNVDDVLSGVTRNRIISIAKQQGLEVNESKVPLELIPSAQEAFISSTTKPLLPVHQINDHVIGMGASMSLTNQLRVALANHIDEYLSHPTPVF